MPSGYDQAWHSSECIWTRERGLPRIGVGAAFHITVLYVIHVLRHEEARGVGVALFDGDGDELVVVRGFLDGGGDILGQASAVDEALADRAEKLRQHGVMRGEEHQLVEA